MTTAVDPTTAKSRRWLMAIGMAGFALSSPASCAWMGGAPSVPVDLVDIRSGERHSCVLTAAGGVKCWGNNHDGQLGDGTVTDHGRPVDVSGLTAGVKAIATGWRHSCAVTSVGRVVCWGNNHDGQLGDGTRADRKKPEDVVGLMSNATALATGERHTCALTPGGGVKCWGNNHDGELGDGTRVDRVTPLDVFGLTSGVKAITAGWRHTCALTAAGGVRCWGNNHDGQLGDGTETDRQVPTDVVGLTNGVTAISARWRQTCALTAVGGVKCWGSNHEGQLGLGTRNDANAPMDVVGLTSGVKAITAGWRHVCALTVNGDVKCWGSNHEGQLGDGTGIDRKVPVDVVLVPGKSLAIAAGGQHSCAMDSRAITCWGDNEDGQLGDGTFRSSLAARREAD
jgi:alpha-tubulin suppressor-like RCC1 family protein